MKHIVFDFDGTLTKNSPNIWREIWTSLGYDTGKGSDYSRFFIMFLTKDITHQEWCDLTMKKFKERNLNKSLVDELSKDIELIDGFEDTVKTLNEKGYQLHICSGNFKNVIENVLKENVKYFASINANTMLFDRNGTATDVVGTSYDFEGKAKFITGLKKIYNVSAQDISFVGNGDNDEWAHKSGCKTLCINPYKTDFTNKTIWHNAIEKVDNLLQTLPYLHDDKNDEDINSSCMEVE